MDRYVDVHGGARGMHRTDLNALAHVLAAARQDKQLTPGELASALHLSPPATSALLTRLETAGHVHRTHDATDRRRVSVEMTDEAMQVGREIFTPVAMAITSVIAGLSARDQAVVERFLADVVAATQDASAH